MSPTAIHPDPRSLDPSASPAAGDDLASLSPLAVLLRLLAVRPFEARALSVPMRLSVAALGLLVALPCAAAWGLAASSSGAHATLENALKVPMLLLVSGAAALPFVLVVSLLVGARGTRLTDLVVAHGAATFAGSLVLLVSAPLVALYQRSSAWAGPTMAVASVAVALTVGAFVLVRALSRLARAATRARDHLLPTAALALIQLAALAQLASVTSPVFGARTRFGQGIDGALRDVPAHVDPSVSPKAEGLEEGAP